jgi:hypothetical protein
VDSLGTTSVFVLLRLVRNCPNYPLFRRVFNGATYFLALQGMFEAHFEEGIIIRARAGDVYSKPIGKMHRGHNPDNTTPYLCIEFCITASDRPHVTNVLKAF